MQKSAHPAKETDKINFKVKKKKTEKVSFAEVYKDTKQKQCGKVFA